MGRCVLAVLLLVVSGMTLTHAEVIALEGTVKAVDADTRTISIERRTAKGTKTLDLEVNKKAGDLSAVKVGDKVSFSYDPDLEVVTKIGVGQSTGNTNPPEIVTLKELRKAYNTSPWVSIDGLRLYWQSAEPDGTRWIWTTSRHTPAELFGSQKKLVPGSDASLTADELEMFVTEKDAIYTAKRTTSDQPFPRPSPLPELRAFGKLARPCVSPDGLTLWCDRVGQGGGPTYRMTRSSRTESWSEPDAIDRSVVAAGNGFQINPTEGWGVFALRKTPAAAGNAFALAMTSDKGLTFRDVRPLRLPGNADGKFPFYCAATKELFFAGHPLPDRTSEILVVRNLELPLSR